MNIISVLEKEGFFLKKEGDFSVPSGEGYYNAVVSAYSTRLIDYKKEPHKEEVERLLESRFEKKKVNSFFKRLEKEGKMIVRRIGGGACL